MCGVGGIIRQTPLAERCVKGKKEESRGEESLKGAQEEHLRGDTEREREGERKGGR